MSVGIFACFCAVSKGVRRAEWQNGWIGRMNGWMGDGCIEWEENGSEI